MSRGIFVRKECYLFKFRIILNATNFESLSTKIRNVIIHINTFVDDGFVEI